MKDYKKILEGIVNIVNTTEKSDIGFANICTYIGENCPELAEQDDDRIRKAIITLILSVPDIYEKIGFSRSDCLAWLEKQGETFTKKDVDDAYLKGVCDTKQELKKQAKEALAKSGNELKCVEKQKAIKFFSPYIQDNSGGYDRERVIEDFKEYMKGE